MNRTLPVALVLLCAGLLQDGQAGGVANANSALAFGARMHARHDAFDKLPFDDGDLTYNVAYEWHETEAYWQIGVGYTPSVNTTNTIESVITPQVALILKDKYWRGGVGALWSMVDDKVSGRDWLNMYWQIILGISFPVAKLQLDVHALYPFEAWNELGNFDFDDIEFGAWLVYPF
jgi:hypothetical protein